MIPRFNKEYLQSRSYESEIIRSITKKNFLAALKEKGFNPENLLHMRKFSIKLIKKFNSSLRRVLKVMNIKMYEMILLLDEEYSTVDSLISILDEKNKQIIRNECIQEFHVNDDDCILFDILS